MHYQRKSPWKRTPLAPSRTRARFGEKHSDGPQPTSNGRKEERRNALYLFSYQLVLGRLGVTAVPSCESLVCKESVDEVGEVEEAPGLQ